MSPNKHVLESRRVLMVHGHARKISSKVSSKVAIGKIIESVSCIASVSWVASLEPKLCPEFGNIEMLWRLSKQVYSSHPGPFICLTPRHIIVNGVGATWFVLMLFTSWSLFRGRNVDRP